MSDTTRKESTIVEFVENYCGATSEELLKTLPRRHLGVIASPSEFLSLLEEQRPTGIGPALKPGELRPVVGNSIADIAAGGIQLEYSQLATGDEQPSSFALDVRSLLLYAHTVIVADPFSPSISLAGPVRSTSLSLDRRITEERVRFGIELICRLAPLIRDRVVFVAPPLTPPDPVDVERAENLLRELIPELALKLVHMGMLKFTDQSDLFLRSRMLAERFLRQEDLLEVLGVDHGTRLVACAAEGAALPVLASLRGGPDLEHSDRWTLTELMRLQLQGAGSIRLSDMVSIRDDNAFTIFRHDMAEAVTWSAAHADPEDSLAQAAVIAEEMRGAAERLRLQTRRSIVLSATLGDVVSWAVGAAIGASIAGWRGAAAGLAGKGLEELLRTGPSRSMRALRNHYVELSKPTMRPDAQSARDKLRALRSGGGIQ